MITFILPGYSAHNRQWAEEIAKKIQIEGEVRPVFWDHWDDPEKTFNPKKKAQDVIDVLLKDNANIIAKSVGTMVAALVVQQIPARIGKVILCGIPSISDRRKEIFKKAFSQFSGNNIIVFQNSKDPFATFEEVKKFVQEVNPKILVVEKPRSDHNYPYTEDFEKFLKS
ncbi:alpha/beta hydrolase [Candidatus Woesebacteria bacterium]|nr:alpha/beta hydrolase [Candidatus Woesebacteria bacterium]